MANLINKNNEDDGGGSTLSEPLRRAIGDRYLTYALSTIMHRALPDARDGLKPVHRRILYAMYRLKLVSNGKFLKSAKISGDTMGDFHPHGDAAIYDAMARLAQDFSVRYPMVDGQGNFGNIDGDNPAAARYTEARMTAVAEAMLIGMEENAVDFQDNYDGRLTEPSVLPASFPNLLANGSTGIAVGMATNIPPHNIGELLDASIHLIKAPNARDETLLDFVPGPDFPTGGILVEPRDSLLETYRTGRGPMRLRSKWEIEDLPRGLWQIVVTEIPYQVQKSRLIEKIAELMNARQLPMLDDIRDESAEDIRIVIEPKSKNLDPVQVMAVLYKQTDLESRFSLNMNLLDSEGVPRVMGLREALTQWLEHRNDVLVRKSKFRLDKITARLEVLDGYLIAYLNLDEVIRIIREEDEPRDELMKAFGLTQVQADAILNMRLRALRKLEEEGIRAEHAALTAEMKELKALLKSDKQQQQIIAAEVKALRQQFGPKTELGKRRTDFEVVANDEAVPLEILVEKEPVTIVCSQKGWIRALKGHAEDGSKLSYKDGDKGAFVLHAMTTDKLVLFVSNGRAYTLDVAKLPGGRGHGDPVRMMLDIEPSDEILEIFVHDPDRKLLVASRIGNGFVVAESEMIANRKAGKQILNVKAPDEAAICVPAIGDKVAVLGENRKLLCFALADVPEMPRGKGVRLQRHGDGHLADARCYSATEGLKIADKAGRERVFTELDEWQGLRAQAGRVRPKGFPTDGLMGPAFPNRL